ncbi:MAG: hypothetical protein IAF02_22295 [Anaerolineae bacterium]|nr:hypothetical protein [Anaerolineae bacterium]
MKKTSKNIFVTIIVTLLIIFFVAQTVGAKPANSPSQQAATGDVIIYGSNNVDNAIVAINLSQAITTQVGVASLPNQAMAQDPYTKYVYMYEAFTTGDELFYWNPTTLANTLAFQFMPPPEEYAKGMDFAPDGTLYLMNDTDEIYSLNINTGAWAYLGNVPNLTPATLYGRTGDIAFAPDGTTYLATYENLYTIKFNASTSTWSSTLIKENMFTQPSGRDYVWTGLAYCDDKLYGSSGEQQLSGQWLSAIYEIDPASGNMVKIISNVGTRLNDLTSCQPKVKRCNLQPNTSYNFRIDPFTATVHIDTLGTLACISMNRYNVSHPEATVPLKTGNYWSITGTNAGGGTAVNFSVTLTLPTTFPPDAQDKLCRYTGSGWDCAMTSFGSNRVTRAGIQTFSDWTVGNDAGPTSITLKSITAHRNAPPQIVWLFGLLFLSIIVLVYRRRHS